MLRWLERWLVYFLIPTGSVLLFAPLSTHRTKTVDEDFVFLEISETLVAASPTTETPPPPKPDSAESAWRQLNEQQRVLADRFSDAAPRTNSYGYRLLRSEEMASYPAVQAAVAEMMRRIKLWPQEKLREERQENVPAEEWRAFQEAYADGGAFQVGNRIFRGHTAPGYATLNTEVKNLRMGCKVVGGLFLALSLIALYGAYTTPPADGIRIGKRSAMIVWDVATVLVGLVFAWWLVDFALEKYFRIEATWGEDFGIGMGVFWAALMNPVVALIATALSLQTLKISHDEIVLKGLFGKTAVAWPEVVGFRVSQGFSPRRVAGLWAPKRVMKLLEIDAGASSLRVMEPPYASTKKEILAALLAHAPDRVKASIEIASKEWLSYL